MSSTQAGPCSRPMRKRRSRARFCRQFHWRSMSKPSLSSKLNVWMWASSCCCRKASAIPRRRIVYSFSMVGCVSIVSSRLLQGGWFVGIFIGIEVLRAADIRMLERRLWLGSRFDGLAVQVALQDRFHARIGAGLQSNGPACGGLQTLRGVLLAQPQNAETGKVALFRMAFGGDDALKQISGGRTNDFGPIHEPDRGPL